MSVNMCTLCVPSHQERSKCVWECNEAVTCCSYVALLIDQLMVVGHWRNESDRVNPKYFDEACPSVTFSITHSRRICLGSDVDLHTKRLATSHLSLGLASECFGVLMTFCFVYCFPNTIVITVPHRNSHFCHDFYHQMGHVHLQR